jgi:hypothetical protein
MDSVINYQTEIRIADLLEEAADEIEKLSTGLPLYK